MDNCESEDTSEPPPIYRLQRRMAKQSIANIDGLWLTYFNDLGHKFQGLNAIQSNFMQTRPQQGDVIF